MQILAPLPRQIDQPFQFFLIVIIIIIIIIILLYYDLIAASHFETFLKLMSSLLLYF